MLIQAQGFHNRSYHASDLPDRNRAAWVLHAQRGVRTSWKYSVTVYQLPALMPGNVPAKAFPCSLRAAYQMSPWKSPR